MKICAIILLLTLHFAIYNSLSECENKITLEKGIQIESTGECIYCSSSSNLISNFLQSSCTCDAFSGFQTTSKKCQKCSSNSISYKGTCQPCQMVILIFKNYLIFRQIQIQKIIVLIVNWNQINLWLNFQ